MIRFHNNNDVVEMETSPTNKKESSDEQIVEKKRAILFAAPRLD